MTPKLTTLEAEERAATEKFERERQRISAERDTLNKVLQPLHVLQQNFVERTGIRERLSGVASAQETALDEFRAAFKACIRSDQPPPPNFFWHLQQRFPTGVLAGQALALLHAEDKALTDEIASLEKKIAAYKSQHGLE